MPETPKHNPTPEPPDDDSNLTPEPRDNEDDGCTCGAECEDLSEDYDGPPPVPTEFRYPPKGIQAYLEFAYYGSPQITGIIAEFKEHGQLELLPTFHDAYHSAVREVMEAFQVTPDITPNQLMRRMFDLLKWLADPLSSVGASAQLSEAGRDRKLAWELAYGNVFALLGHACVTHDEEGPTPETMPDPDEQNMPSDAAYERQIEDLHANITFLKKGMAKLNRRIEAMKARGNEAADPAQDIALNPRSSFTHGPEGILAFLQHSLHNAPESATILANMYGDESLRHMAKPFMEAYGSAIDDIAKAFEESPDITPDQLFAKLWALQRESNETWFQTDRDTGMCSYQTDWGYAWMHGYQAALSILANAVVPTPTSDDILF